MAELADAANSKDFAATFSVLGLVALFLLLPTTKVILSEDFVRLCVGKFGLVSYEKATLKLLRRLFLRQKREACKYHADFRR
jgi:hypothetical protein